MDFLVGLNYEKGKRRKLLLYTHILWQGSDAINILGDCTDTEWVNKFIFAEIDIWRGAKQIGWASIRLLQYMYM